jgi:hypothetical protein
MAGSTVEYDCTLSRNTAAELNRAKRSVPSPGHSRIGGTTPVAAALFGPSTTAPARIGADPSSEPTRFATWCCMQCG